MAEQPELEQPNQSEAPKGQPEGTGKVELNEKDLERISGGIMRDGHRFDYAEIRHIDHREEEQRRS
jgi:hypothetical protein